MNAYSLTAPDDWHIHLRDGEFLNVTANHCAKSFKRAIIMPNLMPPVTTAAMAKAYRARIIKNLDNSASFSPLMTLYLSPEVTPSELSLAHQDGAISAVKWYPKGVTTHSEAGVSDIAHYHDTLQMMSELELPLLIHGEVPDMNADIFERESLFIDEQLKPLIKNFPKLNIVFEHISTQKAAEFVKDAPTRVGATITAHHLWLNRNDLLSGGIKPHHYCLPIVKKQSDQKALIKAATSGSPKFFLGTDSAPHTIQDKQSACGCAGIYTAPMALALYAECFEQADALHKLEGFASHFGADFYNLPRNKETITLIKKEWRVPAKYEYGSDTLIPFMANKILNWQIEGMNHG